MVNSEVLCGGAELADGEAFGFAGGEEVGGEGGVDGEGGAEEVDGLEEVGAALGARGAEGVEGGVGVGGDGVGGEPGDAVGLEGEGEAGSGGAEVVFEGEEEAGGERIEIVGLRMGGREVWGIGWGVGVLDDEVGAAGAGDEGEVAAGAVEGAGGGLFVEVVDGEEGDVELFGEAIDVGGDGADFGGGAGRGEEGPEGVDEDEGGVVGAVNEFAESVLVVAEEEGLGVGVFRGVGIADAAEGEEAFGVAAGGFELGADDGGEAVFGAEVDDGGGLAVEGGGCAVGPGLAGGETGGDIDGEGGFAEIGVAGDEGEGADGDAVEPEPGLGEGFDLVKGDDGGEGVWFGGEGHGLGSLLGIC